MGKEKSADRKVDKILAGPIGPAKKMAEKIVNKAIGTHFDDIRKNSKARLIQVTQGPKSLLNCHLVSFLLDVPMRQCYRWLQPDSFWLPSLELCERIGDFLDQVEELRAFWPGFVMLWPGVPQSIRRTLIPKNIRRTLNDRSLTNREKTEDLTLQILRILRQLAEEEKEHEQKEA